MPWPEWIDRYPNVKRLLERPEDVLEGVSTERLPVARHVYTVDHYAGEPLRAGQRVSFEDDRVVRWSPGQTLIGVALTHAEPGDPVQVQVSEVYFSH